MFSNFCEFKTLVENDIGNNVKVLKSDNGGEYLSNEFKNLCASEGIRRELIAPHNPQHNGFQKDIKKSLWDLHGLCYMVRAYRCTCGRKHATKLFMCGTNVLIGFS